MSYEITKGKWEVRINSVGQRWVYSGDKSIALCVGEDDEALANAEYICGLKQRIAELEEASTLYYDANEALRERIAELKEIIDTHNRFLELLKENESYMDIVDTFWDEKELP